MFTVETTSGFKMILADAGRDADGNQLWRQVRVGPGPGVTTDTYAVIADRQNRLEDDERNMRAARRQLELFQEYGGRERVTVALALLDDSVEARDEAWFDFTEMRGQ